MTSTPVYPGLRESPVPDNEEPPSGDPTLSPASEPCPVGYGDLLSQTGSAKRGEARSAEGSQTPTCEEREISWQSGVSEAPSEPQSPRSGTGSETSKARTERWRALGVLWDVSGLDRVRKCGRVVVAPGGIVGVRKKGEAVGYAGLATCGSVWACPRCSARIMAVRRLELGVLVSWAAAHGMTVAFGTVTLRHRKDQGLDELWAALSKGQQGVTQARKVRRLRDDLGRVGYVRATEVTYGGNGWHPHIHTIQLFHGEVSQEQLDELRDAEFAVWKRQALNRGLGAPVKKRYELRKVVDAERKFSDYFVKSVYDPSVERAAKSVSFEMTGSLTKKGRRKESRTPWQVLEDFGRTGDMDDLDVWHEFETASKGKRALVWSNGLKDLAGVGEVDDETIAEEEVGSLADTLFGVADWSPIVRRPELGSLLLGAVQSGGMAGGLAFCREHGIAVELLSEGDC